MTDVLLGAYEESQKVVDAAGGLKNRTAAFEAYQKALTMAELEDELKKRSEAASKGRLAKRGSMGLGLDPAKDRVKSGEEDWSGGWALDAHKNLPGLKLIYKRFPNVDWYLMIDDDSYVMMDNLKMHLQQLDPNKKHYIGQMNRFKGCDGVKEYGTGPHFAQGGAGIVISRGAMVAMMENIDDCIVRYKDCWGEFCVIMSSNATYRHTNPNQPEIFGWGYACEIQRFLFIIKLDSTVSR
ncbi:hypothetical protein HDU81_010155 [Chytriomyces hyalinus]|nr:hypothetical protein HDU81_010155 [Chytriomyces hyalinus]